MGPESRKATATVLQQQQQQRLAGKQLPGNGWLQGREWGRQSPTCNRVAPIKRIPPQRFEDAPKKGPHLKSKPPVSKRSANSTRLQEEHPWHYHPLGQTGKGIWHAGRSNFTGRKQQVPHLLDELFSSPCSFQVPHGEFSPFLSKITR